MKIRINFTNHTWCEGDLDASRDDVWQMVTTAEGGRGMRVELADGRAIIFDRDKMQNIVMLEDR